MCNLYDIGPARRTRTNVMKWEAEVARLVDEIGRDYVAPAKSGIAVRATAGTLEPKIMRWGFSRPWSAAINNAREDKLDGKTWADAWRARRCVIPVRQFYEWSGEKGSKTKHEITPAGMVSDWFYIGGLWEDNDRPDIGLSYTMLTTAANPQMSKIHHRMPLILRNEELEGFVSGDDPERFLEPFAGELDFRPTIGAQLSLDL